MNKTVCGTCSNCGGCVSTPTFYHSIVPPVPQCESCGAVAAAYGPVIPMQPAPVRWVGTTTLDYPAVFTGVVILREGDVGTGDQ